MDNKPFEGFEHLKDALNTKLFNQGYQIVHEQHDDKVYDSCFVIWSNNIDALRLTWDGKEAWFILEVVHTLPISPLSAWETIIIKHFDITENNSKDLIETTEGILGSLS